MRTGRELETNLTGTKPELETNLTGTKPELETNLTELDGCPRFA
jgi:hypothetical protein